MWVVILIVVGFVIIEAAGQGWELYMHDPGPAEYLVSLIFVAAVIAGVLGVFKRL